MLRWIEETNRNAISALEQDSSAVEQDSSAVEQDSSAVKQDSSALEQDSSAVEQVSSAVEQYSPAVERVALNADEEDFLTPCSEVPSELLSTAKNDECMLSSKSRTLDPRLLEAIEEEVQALGGGLQEMLQQTCGSLTRASKLSADCAKTFDDAVTHMGDAVEGAASSLEAMMAECATLEEAFDNMDATAARIKAIRTEVDQLDALVRRSKKIKGLKAALGD